MANSCYCFHNDFHYVRDYNSCSGTEQRIANTHSRSPLSSSMFAPGVEQVMEEFHFSDADLATFVVSIYVLGFAIGPLIIAPLSELNGRRIVYLISNLLFVIFTIGCALSSNLGMLFAFRFLAGCAGATPVTLGGASIGDMFPKENRGAAMAVWGMGPILGPVLGPVIGGFLAQAKGWRWAFWLQAIVSGSTLLLGAVFLRETYAVAILEHKTQRLIRETGDRDLVSALRDGTPGKEHFKRAIIRPIKMLLFSPIILLFSLYMALIFGYLYLFLTTFPTVFQEQYGFNTGVTGLSYLGVGIGSFVGLIMAGKSSDPLYAQLTAKNHGVGRPEFRLPPLMFTCPLIVIAFFWYGWSAEVKTHWIVPIIGTSLFGMGMIPAFVSSLSPKNPQQY
jgi:multidrug resistance protein